MSDIDTEIHSHDLLLIGGGAPALGLLCSLIRTGKAEDCSILMLDDAPARCGRSGAYAHTYDVPVGTLRACLTGLPDMIRGDHDLTSGIADLDEGDQRVPRPQVEAFLARLKRLVLNHLRRNGSLILRAARCNTLSYEAGLWSVDNQPGSDSRRAVLACSASEKKTRILSDLLECGLSPDKLEKVVRSTDALGRTRDDIMQRLIASKGGQAVVLSRSDSVATAVRDQLLDWGRALNPDSIQTRLMTSAQSDDLSQCLSEADLIVTALGETPDFPRILVDGQVVKMGASTSVDSQSRLVNHAAHTLPSIHAVGPGLDEDWRRDYNSDTSDDLALWFADKADMIIFAPEREPLVRVA